MIEWISLYSVVCTGVTRVHAFSIQLDDKSGDDTEDGKVFVHSHKKQSHQKVSFH